MGWGRRKTIVPQSRLALYTPPMLTRLIRVTKVARMLGVCPATAKRWLALSDIQAVSQPVLGHGRIGRGNAPLYVSLEGAVALADALLPGKANRLALQRSRAWMAAQARKLEDSTRNMRHAVGGTGLEAPTPKQPL